MWQYCAKLYRIDVPTRLPTDQRLESLQKNPEKQYIILFDRYLVSQSVATPAYGIGIMTILIGVAASLIFYQGFYYPESLLKPHVEEHILHPTSQTVIEMIPGSQFESQEQNFVPKLLNIQLGIDNHLIWHNNDDVGHTVTASHRYEDSYSGPFGGSEIIMPGESYEFLFTVPVEHLEYFCVPHPWMTGEIEVTKQRF